MRDRGELELPGVDRRRISPYRDLIWWEIGREDQMHVYVRKLRTDARLTRGLEPAEWNAKGIRQAREFRKELEFQRNVVDYDKTRKPEYPAWFIRSARVDELNPDETLVQIVAAPPQGWLEYLASLPR